MRVSILIAALILSFSSEATERQALELSFCSANSRCNECNERVLIELSHEDRNMVILANTLDGSVIRETLTGCIFSGKDDFSCDLGRAELIKVNQNFGIRLKDDISVRLRGIEVCVRKV